MLNCQYKFILANNIIILFVSSDDFRHLIWGWKIANMDYSLFICIKKNEEKTYINLNSQAKVKGVKTIKY